MPKAATDGAVLGPSFSFSRPRDIRNDPRQPKLIERQVVVTNPDGTRTEHTFWTDGHIDPVWSNIT
jgi:hypothetical protein